MNLFNKSLLGADKIISISTLEAVSTYYGYKVIEPDKGRTIQKGQIWIWRSCYYSPKWTRACFIDGAYRKHKYFNNLIDAIEYKEEGCNEVKM